MDREIRTVLLIDSSASILFYLGMLLKRLEYKVETAQNAEDALRMMDGTVPSIVITEVSLPGMGGIHLLKRMKETPRLKAIPVVMLTSRCDTGMVDTCTRLGCAAFLYKPVEPDVLYRKIQAVSESIPRENIRLSTSLKVIVGEGSAPRAENATAISEGGLFVRTLSPLQRNTVVRVRIFLPKKEITATAIVLYSANTAAGTSKEPGMGMKFVEISDADRGVIRGFIKERLISGIKPPGA